jgi:hypothetical protein
MRRRENEPDYDEMKRERDFEWYWKGISPVRYVVVWSLRKWQNSDKPKRKAGRRAKR